MPIRDRFSVSSRVFTGAGDTLTRSSTTENGKDDGGYSATRSHPGLLAEAPPSDPINAFYNPMELSPMVPRRTSDATTNARVAHPASTTTAVAA